MTNAFWDEVRDLFHAASSAAPSARADLLKRADTDVRNEVESLLAAHDEPGAFLDRSVWDLIDAHEGERLAGSLIGAYRIVKPLGRGGMGTVFLATREGEEFTQRVAIKLVRGGEALVQRFRQERQILANLDHPNIARLVDGGTTADGLPYLGMEYVDGTPIDAFARALPIAGKLRLFLELCDAVQYAHRSLIIHRDIKPGNVLVTADGMPKLLDFGIAKLASPDDTRPAATPTRLMTPEYASPEQLLGRLVTTATDVYSLGVLLFELLTGEKPFDGATRTAATEAPRASSLVKALRGDLDTILGCALEVDPARRYGSVERLADDVRRHLSGHPVLARRPTFGYRAAKFVRRNVLAVAAAAIIAIVTAVAFVVTFQQKQIAERRFEEVRSLAHSVVYELHDAIEPLPGSTPARELLVRRALVYLDALAAEAQDNGELQLEVAGAYMKIGDVQGLPYRANLGDTAGALTSYRKGLQIVQQMPESELTADLYDRVGICEQRAYRWDEALAAHQRARAIRETLPLTPALAQTWTAIGDCRYIGQHSPTAEQAYEAALAVLAKLPHSPDALMESGRAHQRLGGFYSGIMLRDWRKAIAHHDAALRALGERSALAPADTMARRNWADQIVMKATAQNMMGDAAGALDSTTRALVILRELAAADPKNTEAQKDLAFAYGEQGAALRKLGREAEARDAFLGAVAIYERRVAADPASEEDRRDLQKMRAALSSGISG
ncbi:MAG TPA: serine/threonine-protein kinase [Thermoanaerobaculia bacterium]|nr:serine/threonine-protein kinase [Thermoanaerobaculia bacterium]